MLTFYINDHTSKNFFGHKKEKKNVEKEIGSFAVMIDSITKSQALVDYAEELGLTVDNLNYANYGDYLTFGVDSKKDISYVEYKSDIPYGAQILTLRDAVDAVEDMAEAKNILLVADVLREKTYRELATGVKDYKKTEKKKTRKPSYKKEQECKCNFITVSDHFIINDMTDEIMMFKKPQDKVNVYVSY